MAADRQPAGSAASSSKQPRPLCVAPQSHWDRTIPADEQAAEADRSDQGPRSAVPRSGPENCSRLPGHQEEEEGSSTNQQDRPDADKPEAKPAEDGNEHTCSPPATALPEQLPVLHQGCAPGPESQSWIATQPDHLKQGVDQLLCPGLGSTSAAVPPMQPAPPQADENLWPLRQGSLQIIILQRNEAAPPGRRRDRLEPVEPRWIPRFIGPSIPGPRQAEMPEQF